LGALYYSILSAVALMDDIDGSWAELVAMGTEAPRWANLYFAVFFLVPGVFALFGGLAGVWTYWMFQPAKASNSAVKEPRNELLPSPVPPSHLSRRLLEAIPADGIQRGNVATEDGAGENGR
jgi:hypothetical protein